MVKIPQIYYAAATDYTARYIRYGMMTREEAIPVIKERDGARWTRCVREFCEFAATPKPSFGPLWTNFISATCFTRDAFGHWMLKNPSGAKALRFAIEAQKSAPTAN